MAASQPLTRTQKIAVSLHETFCKSCRIAAAQVKTLDHAIQSLRDSDMAEADSAALSPDARARIRAKLNRSGQ